MAITLLTIHWIIKLNNGIKSIADIKGNIVDNYIEINGIKIKNSFKQMPLIVVENFYNENYNFLDINNGKYICIDIGANIGISDLYLANKDFISKIYAFEPLKPTFNFLKENLELNPKLKEKIVPYNFGLGGKDSEIEVNFNLDNAMSISDSGVFDKCFSTDSKETIIIKQASGEIENIIKTVKDEEKIFLKIDCEGAEYDILKNLDENDLLKFVDVIILEFHNGNLEFLTNILNKNKFFCFADWERRDEFQIGLIKALKIK